jgi:hypothetical protein
MSLVQLNLILLVLIRVSSLLKVPSLVYSSTILNSAFPTKKLVTTPNLIIALNSDATINGWLISNSSPIVGVVQPINTATGASWVYKDFSFDGVDSISVNANFRIALFNMTAQTVPYFSSNFALKYI